MRPKSPAVNEVLGPEKTTLLVRLKNSLRKSRLKRSVNLKRFSMRASQFHWRGLRTSGRVRLTLPNWNCGVRKKAAELKY